MALSIWEMFVALFGERERDEEESEGEGDDGRFVPSPLDLSVRVAHGGDGERLRALSKIDTQATELEEEQGEN